MYLLMDFIFSIKALYNGKKLPQFGNLLLCQPGAAANKDENFYLNYKEASGTKRRSQISAGG